MHQVHLSDAVERRIRARRPGIGLFGAIQPQRTAHIVVDLQNGFMAPGAVAEIGTAREIVPNVNRISAALRAAGGLVVYIQNTFDAETLAGWSVFFEHFYTPERRAAMIEAFTPGNWQHDLYPELDVQQADLTVRKRRFGAFIQGASDLHAILQARGIDTVIVTGTASNVCCESTARDAMMLNYKVFFVADANAGHNDEEHNATVSAMANYFADVSTTEAVISLIAPADRLAHAAE